MRNVMPSAACCPTVGNHFLDAIHEQLLHDIPTYAGLTGSLEQVCETRAYSVFRTPLLMV